MIDTLKFPIGEFVKPSNITDTHIKEWINDIEQFPSRLNNEVANLSGEQLDTVYRENGWTIRQVIHHCADSHMNSLTRFKLTLTEDNPNIRPYYEDRWAELADSKSSISPALKMLEGLHQRWVVLLNSLTANDLERRFTHPEHGKQFSLKENVGIYAWHCNHHLAHITTLKAKMNW